jgi:antitoxin CptB
MSAADPARERIRWRCRRGMLELDLVLSAFLKAYLEGLEPRALDPLCSLLARPDPELLDYVMGHREPACAKERELVALMRRVNVRIAA